MSATHPHHRQGRQHRQDQQYRLGPQYQQGQHVCLPDGTHAHVLAQRGMTLWLRPNTSGSDRVRTSRADAVELADSPDPVSTDYAH